jgi:hypothetical protein
MTREKVDGLSALSARALGAGSVVVTVEEDMAWLLRW